jgi:4,5-dihydroxyphthalate decarboxylase
MSDLPMSFACGPYDRTLSLMTGEIRPKGIALDYQLVANPRQIFDRMAGAQAFDAAEFSASEFIARDAAGQNPFVAIPAFPSRVFRHGFIFVNRQAGIHGPKDLEGKRVGVPLYTQTAAIFIRGLLQHEYGVDLSRIQWVQGALNDAGSHGSPTVMPLLKPATIEVNRSGKSLSALLAEGALDAVISAALPDTLGQHADVVRLFPDYRSVEKEYYRRTKIFPIMHLVAIRRALYEQHPFVAGSLYQALQEAKALTMKRMRYVGALAYMLPWLPADIEEIDEAMGPDHWPYGVEANRPTMQALTSYMQEQGLIAEQRPLEQLFVPV